MKKTLIVGIALLCCNVSFSQKANVTWGDEFKMKKGSTDLEVIHTDPDGVFVKESHNVLKTYFVIGMTTREAATIVKLDKNLNEVYRQDFNKELKGKEFESFFFLKEKLFILASDYDKKDKSLVLFGAEVNKKDGELKGDWIEITSWQKEVKSEGIDFKAGYNADSTKMILVSTVSGKAKNTYEVKAFDNKLKSAGKTITITNEFDPKTFLLEDVIYTASDKILMVGRNFEYEEGKKKKSKFLQFTNYSIRLYDNAGSMLKEINTDIKGKWLISTRVLQVPNRDLVLAAFYSNEKKGKEINGMLVQRFNPLNGDVVSTSVKEINTSLIDDLNDDDEEDDEDETKKEKKERKKLEKIQADEDGFSRYMRFRNFVITPDNGLIVMAEKYHHYTYTTTTYSGGGAGMGTMGGRSTTTTYHVYQSGDIMMSKVDKAGDITWMHVVPKYQSETIRAGSSTSSGPGISFSVGHSFFKPGINRPYYGGFGVLPTDKHVNIIFNDTQKNEKVLQLGQKCKTIAKYSKSQCYNIQLDMMTGKYTRTSLFSNSDNPTAMPRLGVNLNNELYIVGKEDRLMGKTKIAVAKIGIKG